VGTATAVGSDGEPVIKVFTARSGITGIPKDLDGFPVNEVVTGRFYALVDPTARFDRPVPIGVSTGHPDITAGTIGCRVTDGTNIFALSNNHVYANSNDASIGDNVLQPGTYDGGVNPGDAIGTLYQFVPIEFGAAINFIDAAIALSSADELQNTTPADDQYGNEGYGVPNSAIHPAFGDPDVIDPEDDDLSQLMDVNVQKYGRTTGATHGQISGIGARVDVCYDDACTLIARFVDQIIISPGTFSDSGDSGSLIVSDDEHRYPIGLLFAGGSSGTIANRIDRVLTELDVTVDGESPAPVTDISVASISAPENLLLGDVIDVDVTVENVGNQDVAEDIVVSVVSDNTTPAESGDDISIGADTISGGLAAGTSVDLTFEWASSAAAPGTHTLEASHGLSDDDATNNAATATVEVTDSYPETMHIGALDGFFRRLARITITVHDADEQPVSSATVKINDGRFDLTCTTGESGTCSVIRRYPPRFRCLPFTVVDITHGTLSYTPEENHDPDGDSDGTTITVCR